jgi:DNA (cytosine-5)-methyltransferase 1
MVGFRDNTIDFEFPEPVPLKMTMSDVFEGKVPRDVGFTLRVGGVGSGLHDRRNWDTYLVDGVPKRLSPKEGLRMQGFPEDFIFPVSNNQALKQLGNAVAIPAIQATANEIMKRLKNAKSK